MQTLDQQLEQIEAMSLQHYPNEEAARKDFIIRMLTERLRAFTEQFQALPVKEQTL